MHILIIPSEEFVPKNDHLAGTFQLDQARVLREAGYRVGVISIRLRYSLPMIVRALLNKTTGKKSGNVTDGQSATALLCLLYNKLFRPGTFISIESIDGIDVYRMEGFYKLPPSGRKDYRWWLSAGRKAFEKYIKDNGRPDFIHAHNAIYAGILANSLKGKFGIEYLLTEHSSFFARKLYHPALLPKASDAFKHARQLFVVSGFLGRGLQEIVGPITYKVLPNIVAPEFERAPLAKEEKPYFLFVSIGNLIPLKRHSSLIHAFHKAFDADENVRLEIIGEGEAHQELNDLIIDLEETGRISLKGLYRKEEILEVFNTANVLCLQSEYETFGVVVLEALFRGTPVVVTRCGGPNNIVENTDGIMIDVDDEDGFALALRKIYQSYRHYDFEQIRRNAMRRFGADVFLANIEAALREKATVKEEKQIGNA